MDDSEPKDLSTRVTSTRLVDYAGKNVRLACKVLRFDGPKIVVEASDGGQVTVNVPAGTDITGTYIEVVGKVTSASSITMYSCVSLGDNLDMKLVNDTIELIHDPRFYTKMFC